MTLPSRHKIRAEHATSRSRRLPTILNLYEWPGKKHFVSLQLEGQSGARTRDLRLSKQTLFEAALTTAPTSQSKVRFVWYSTYQMEVLFLLQVEQIFLLQVENISPDTMKT